MNNRITFVVRSDAATKPGGDLVQTEAYVAEFERQGWDARITPWRPSIQFEQSDYTALVNIDRPYELLQAARCIPTERLLLVPIHHADRVIAHLRRSEAKVSLKRRALNLLPSRYRELATFLVRGMQMRTSAKNRLSSALLAAADSVVLRNRLEKLFKTAALTLVLSRTELNAIRDDFGAEPRRHVLAPNGVSANLSPLPWSERVDRVLVVGRIEPRKRQVELLRAAETTGLGLTFIGKADTNSSSYGEEFARLVRQSSLSEWLGPLPHGTTIQMMGASKVLLNASWAEVQSLVELEAASSGCHVVTMRSGSAEEYLPKSFAIHSLDTPLDRVAGSAKRLIDSNLPPEPFYYPYSWVRSVAAMITALEANHD